MVKIFLLVIVFQINSQLHALGDPMWFYVEKYEPENKVVFDHNYHNKLKEIKELLDSGIINESEFENIRRKIIEKMQ
jgi:hypothetical protein